MGFIRQQQEKLAMHYLAWRYHRANLPLPPTARLKRQAADIVADAHRIARERGRNVAAIIRELVEDIKKKE